MEHLQKEVSREQACRFLSRFSFAFPDRADSHELTLGASRCWMLDTPHGRILYAVEMYEGALWVTAAAGLTRAPAVDWLARALQRRAAEQGASAICFYTARRGLVRVARRYGYRVTKTLPKGWELRKF